MTALATTRAGRIVLHLLAMCGNREFAHHMRGIGRELWRQA